MKFFSGFMFEGESELFDEFLDRSEFCVAGFSLGAIRALEYVKNQKERVDRLQLFSPAFFQDKSEKFKRVQIIHFQKNKNQYIENFYSNLSFSSPLDLTSYKGEGTLYDLEFLLEYRYKKDDLEYLLGRGVEIEVYLGERDKIIDIVNVEEFFKDFATMYILKNRGHILHG